LFSLGTPHNLPIYPYWTCDSPGYTISRVWNDLKGCMSTSLSQSLRTNRVGNLRLREICSVALVTSIEDVVRAMVQRRTGCALVMDGNTLVGIFTERDFLNRVVAKGVDAARSVHEVMTTEPKIIDSHATVLAAVEMMEKGGFRHLPVVKEDRQPIGVLSVKDVVHYMVESFPAKVYNLPPTPAALQLAREGA
jgi:CBS domain-containing protein